MGETLNEQYRVKEDGPLDCKLLLLGKNDQIRKWVWNDGTFQESIG